MNSITFNFMSTDFPTQNLPNLYENIFRSDYDEDIIVTDSGGDPIDFGLDYTAALEATKKKLEIADNIAQGVLDQLEEYKNLLTGPVQIGDLVFEED